MNSSNSVIIMNYRRAIINHKIKFNEHLYNQVFINKEVWRLQIMMKYHWSVVVQIIDFSSMDSQNRISFVIIIIIAIT